MAVPKLRFKEFDGDWTIKIKKFFSYFWLYTIAQ
jgi:hypothetical protein